MGKTLYLECNSGISGDMTVGALLDLGADRQVLEHALESLGVDGYHLHFGRKIVCGLDAYDFDVHLEEDEGRQSHEGACEGDYRHSHVEASEERHRHGEACEGGHGHSHSYGEACEDGHGHSHSYGEACEDGHGHSHSYGEACEGGHSHSHGESEGGHSHSHGESVGGHSHSYGEACEDGHSHRHGECGGGHSHSYGEACKVGHSHSYGEACEAGHSHSHGEACEDAHSHSQGECEGDHSHSHGEACEGGHRHSHEEAYEHGHIHSHSHVHRNLFDIYQIIDRLESSERVKELARRMFRIVAEAEAKAHGLPVEQVHFHEVGAVDSIVDIISVAVCVDNLGIDDVVVSALAEGRGHVKCQHGILPVPVPATANIALAHGLDLRFTDNEGEMVTPTGAAIAAALRTRANLPDSCQILKIGMGAGSRVFRQANVLRAMLMEARDSTESKAGMAVSHAAVDETMKDGNSMWVLETNLDDCSGEILGFTMELLLEAGAADVWYSPIFMKKNRPAYILSVLCGKEERVKMEEIILVHTTTIGIRYYPVARTVLVRERMTVDTAWGQADVKVCTHKDRKFYYPEYESVRRICRGTGRDFMTVYQEVRMEAESKGV